MEEVKNTVEIGYSAYLNRIGYGKFDTNNEGYLSEIPELTDDMFNYRNRTPEAFEKRDELVLAYIALEEKN